MVDFYLRVLNHIDEIVVDREIVRTEAERDRNSQWHALAEETAPFSTPV
jgi:hypothetical protein